jgi:hypothetical protein
VKRKTRKNERANSKIEGRKKKKKKTEISEPTVAYNLQQNKQSRHYLSRNQSGTQ